MRTAVETIPAFGSFVRQLMSGRRGFEGAFFCERTTSGLDLEDAYQVQCTRTGYSKITGHQLRDTCGDDAAVVRLVYRACVDAYRDAARGPDLDHQTIPFRIGYRNRKHLQPRRAA